MSLLHRHTCVLQLRLIHPMCNCANEGTSAVSWKTPQVMITACTFLSPSHLLAAFTKVWAKFGASACKRRDLPDVSNDLFDLSRSIFREPHTETHIPQETDTMLHLEKSHLIHASSTKETPKTCLSRHVSKQARMHASRPTSKQVCVSYSCCYLP